MDLLLCELKLRASARVVLQDDGDSRGLVDYEPGWVNGAGGHDVVVVAPGAQVGQQRQRRQEYSDPGDVGEPEQQTDDEQRQAGCQECTAAGGEYAPDSGPRLGHVWIMSGSRGPGPCRSVRCGRNGYSPDDVVDDIGAGASGHLRLTGRDEAMGQYGLNQGPGPCRSVRCGRNGYSPDDVVDDIGAGASGHLRLTGRDEAMGQYGLNQRLNIIGSVSYTHLRAH